MSKLTCDQISEIMTNYESDEESNFESDDSSSGMESDGEDLVNEIRKKLVSKLSQNNVSSSFESANKSLSGEIVTSTNITDQKESNVFSDTNFTNNCSYSDDPYSYSSSPNISIQNLDLNSFDIQNMPIFFDDEYNSFTQNSNSHDCITPSSSNNV